MDEPLPFFLAGLAFGLLILAIALLVKAPLSDPTPALPGWLVVAAVTLMILSLLIGD